MNKHGFALIESILLFAGAILICSAIISSFFSSEHFDRIVKQLNQGGKDEILESLYEN